MSSASILAENVAIKLAANRPERVEKLVLINTPAFDELPAKDITQMQRRTARFAFSLTRGVMGAAPLLEGVLKGSVANPEHMPMKLVARYLAPFVGKDGANHLLTPEFYERRGFARVGEVTGYPRGHSHISLAKPLASTSR